MGKYLPAIRNHGDVTDNLKLLCSGNSLLEHFAGETIAERAGRDLADPGLRVLINMFSLFKLPVRSGEHVPLASNPHVQRR